MRPQFCRQVMMLTAATACAAMSRKPGDDAIIDINCRGVGAPQPFSKQNGGHRLRNPSPSAALAQAPPGGW
jgi:hypothetical protein